MLNSLFRSLLEVRRQQRSSTEQMSLIFSEGAEDLRTEGRQPVSLIALRWTIGFPPFAESF